MIKTNPDLHDAEDIKKSFLILSVPYGSTVPNLVVFSEENGKKYKAEVLANQDLEKTLSGYESPSTVYSGLNVQGFKTATRVLANNRDSTYEGIITKLNSELLETKPF